MEHNTHTFPPIYDEKSKILILGTFPSVKSRELAFYYGHPQNRFWKLLAYLAREPVPAEIEEKKALLLKHGIAIWDVIHSCDIEGSSDSSIKNVVPNDIASLLKKAPIRHIYANGGKAYELYLKYCAESCSVPISKLPSTSPANAASSFEKLCSTWDIILKSLS